jgi:hypothetical protein
MPTLEAALDFDCYRQKVSELEHLEVIEIAVKRMAESADDATTTEYRMLIRMDSEGCICTC